MKIVIARQNSTIKKVFSAIMNDLQHKKVGNLCIVLNDNKFYRDQYGYGYNNKSEKRKREKREHMGNAILKQIAKSRKS